MQVFLKALLQIAIQTAKQLSTKPLTTLARAPKKGYQFLFKETSKKEFLKQLFIKKGKRQMMNVIPKEFKFMYKFFNTEDKLKLVISQINHLEKFIKIPTKEAIRREIQRQNWEQLEAKMKGMQKNWNSELKQQELEQQKKYREYLRKFEQERRRSIQEQLKRLKEERRRLERENKKNELEAEKIAKSLALEQMKRDRINQQLGQVIVKRALDQDWKSFRDFTMSLTPQEKINLSNILETQKEMYIVFDSSWIKFATFTPYYKINVDFNKNNWDVKDMITPNSRGIMTIEVKKPSKDNPKGIYSWINISYGTWLKITNSPTGENFWKQYYKTNRKNVKHITPKSIYYKRKRI